MMTDVAAGTGMGMGAAITVAAHVQKLWPMARLSETWGETVTKEFMRRVGLIDLPEAAAIAALSEYRMTHVGFPDPAALLEVLRAAVTAARAERDASQRPRWMPDPDQVAALHAELADALAWAHAAGDDEIAAAVRAHAGRLAGVLPDYAEKFAAFGRADLLGTPGYAAAAWREAGRPRPAAVSGPPSLFLAQQGATR
jgi:hypothetical protein